MASPRLLSPSSKQFERQMEYRYTCERKRYVAGTSSDPGILARPSQTTTLAHQARWSSQIVPSGALQCVQYREIERERNEPIVRVQLLPTSSSTSTTSASAESRRPEHPFADQKPVSACHKKEGRRARNRRVGDKKQRKSSVRPQRLLRGPSGRPTTTFPTGGLSTARKSSTGLPGSWEWVRMSGRNQKTKFGGKSAY